MSMEEFSERTDRLLEKLWKPFCDVILEQKPDTAMMGCCLAALVKGFSNEISDKEAKGEFLRLIINDLHNHRHKEG